MLDVSGGPSATASRSSGSGNPSDLSNDQMVQLLEEMLYTSENEEQNNGNGIVDDSLFEDDDDENVEGQGESVITTDMGGVGSDEINDEAGGVMFEYLKSLIEKIKKEIIEAGQPLCYKNGTFWHRRRDAVFALEASRMTSSGINPRELYFRDVFVWLLGLPTRLPGEPEVLYCPTCQKERRQRHHLIRKGFVIII